MDYKIGWKQSALITVIFLWLFSIYDNVAVSSEVYAFVATVFLIATILNAFFTMRKFWSESKKEKRKRSTPSVIRQARPK